MTSKNEDGKELQRKLELLRLGRYSCPHPAHCTKYWQPRDWVKYIDEKGEWK